MKTRLLLLTVVLVLAGCSHAPPRQATGLTVDGFWKEQEVRRTKLAAISAKLRLRYEAVKEGVSGKGRLLAQMPRGLRLELRDPLGRVQYQVTLFGDDFAAYYPSQKRAYVDSKAGVEYMKRFLGFPLSFRDLQNLLVGVLPDSLASGKLAWEWDASAGLYRGKTDKNHLRIAVDPDTAALRQVDWDSGRETASVKYDSFFPCCGHSDAAKLRLGGLVTVSLEKTHSQVEAEWEDIVPVEAKADPEPFRAALPADVRRIPLP